VAPSHQEKQSRDRKQPNLYSRITHFDETTPLVESSKVCRTPCRSAASPPPSRRLDSTRCSCGDCVRCNGIMTAPETFEYPSRHHHSTSPDAR
jgi:hypothetical protein